MIKKHVQDFERKGGGKPSLAALCNERLGIKIQSGEHSPVQDALAALRIYLGGSFCIILSNVSTKLYIEILYIFLFIDNVCLLAKIVCV